MEQLKQEVKADHDRLIRVEAKLDSLCHTITTFITKVEKDRTELIEHSSNEHKELIDKIDRNFDKVQERFLKEDDDCTNCKNGIHSKIEKKVSVTIFMWIVGGLAGLMIMMGVMFGSIVVENNKQITKLDHELGDHIAFAVLVYEQITGKPWGQAAREDLETARENYRAIREKALQGGDPSNNSGQSGQE